MAKKNLNEAQYTLSVDGLETDDANTLSQILSLAGSVETPTDLGIGSPMDADLGLGSTNDLMGDEQGDFFSGSASDDMAVGMDALDVEPQVDPMGDEGVPGELGAEPVAEPMDMDDEVDMDDDMDRIMELSGFEEGMEDEDDEAGDSLEDLDQMMEDVDFNNRPEPHDVEDDSFENSFGEAQPKKYGGDGDNRLDDKVDNKVEIDEAYDKMLSEFEEFKAERA